MQRVAKFLGIALAAILVTAVVIVLTLTLAIGFEFAWPTALLGAAVIWILLLVFDSVLMMPYS